MTFENLLQTTTAISQCLRILWIDLWERDYAESSCMADFNKKDNLNLLLYKSVSIGNQVKIALKTG